MKKMCFLFAGAVLMIFVFGCDSPEKAFESWREAIVNGKIDDANKVTVEKSQLLNSFMVKAVKSSEKAENQMKSLKIVGKSVSGEYATLQIKDGDGVVYSFDMKKEDGKWKAAPQKR